MNRQDLKPKKHCARTVTKNRYEKLDVVNRNWWNNKFHEIETNSRRAYHEKADILAECFTNDEVNELMKTGLKVVQTRRKSDITLSQLYRLKEVVKTNLRTQTDTKKNVFKNTSKYTNPYLNFMKKTVKEARVWNPSSKDLTKVPLVERTELAERQLAENFLTWFTSVSPTKPQIDLNILLSIFQITFNYPIFTSLMREVKRVGHVPEVTAKYLALPQMTERSALQREIKKDVRACSKKPRKVAFGKCLPEDMKHILIKDMTKKWFEYRSTHLDLKTWSAVFQDIMGLETTRGYCAWLLKNPRAKRPEYLHSLGMNKMINQEPPLPDILDLANAFDLDWEITGQKLKKSQEESKTRYSITIL